jgi:AraC-like DNA-binding protein
VIRTAGAIRIAHQIRIFRELRPVVRRYHLVQTSSCEELAQVVPGGRFRVSTQSGRQFYGLHQYLMLDGLMLNQVTLGQSIVAVGGERDKNSTVCSVIGPAAAMNGSAVDDGDLTLVHSGDPFTLSTAAAATLHSFTLEPAVGENFPELDLPFGFADHRRPGRWKVDSNADIQRFVRLLDDIFAMLGDQPTLADTPAVRRSICNAATRAIAGLADHGAFVPDVAAAGRHTQIMLRFERALEEVEPESLDMRTLCRATRTSRRTLEAVVRSRTGRSPWDYLRWRRLLRARERLSRPDATTRVTDVASDLGIWHLGRFAGEYAAAFGETPIETLRRGRAVVSSLLQ